MRLFPSCVEMCELSEQCELSPPGCGGVESVMGEVKSGVARFLEKT
jgi:hypothetical protein